MFLLAISFFNPVTRVKYYSACFSCFLLIFVASNSPACITMSSVRVWLRYKALILHLEVAIVCSLFYLGPVLVYIFCQLFFKPTNQLLFSSDKQVVTNPAAFRTNKSYFIENKVANIGLRVHIVAYYVWVMWFSETKVAMLATTELRKLSCHIEKITLGLTICLAGFKQQNCLGYDTNNFLWSEDCLNGIGIQFRRSEIGGYMTQCQYVSLLEQPVLSVVLLYLMPR